jgi:hypothetical protein
MKTGSLAVSPVLRESPARSGCSAEIVIWRPSRVKQPPWTALAPESPEVREAVAVSEFLAEGITEALRKLWLSTA